MAALESNNNSNISRPLSAAQSQKSASRVASAKSTRNEKELSSHEPSAAAAPDIVGDQPSQPVLLTEVDVPETVTEPKEQSQSEETSQPRPKSAPKSRPLSAKSAKSRPVSSKGNMR